MQITTKGRYGLRILLDIARQGEGPASVAEIAKRQGISLKYAEQLAGTLVRGGLRRGVRGAAGGYALLRSPSEYAVGEILRCMEGTLAPVSCAESGYPCERAEECGVRALWEGLYALDTAYFDAVTLSDLLSPSLTSADLVRKMRENA